jgi:hypothetical protein
VKRDLSFFNLMVGNDKMPWLGIIMANALPASVANTRFDSGYQFCMPLQKAHGTYISPTLAVWRQATCKST